MVRFARALTAYWYSVGGVACYSATNSVAALPSDSSDCYCHVSVYSSFPLYAKWNLPSLLICYLPAMKSTRKILGRILSKPNHCKRRVYYPSASETHISVGGVTIQVDDVEFPEYDPTPYGGGYDLALTYGKPLPPSDAICYPPSPWDPDSSALEGFSYGSIASPYGKEPDDHGVAEEFPSTDDVKKQPSYALPEYYNGCWGNDFFSGSFHDCGCSCCEGKTPLGKEENYGWGHAIPENQPTDDYHSNYAEPYGDSFSSWLWTSQEDNNYYYQGDASSHSSASQWDGAGEYLFGSSFPYFQSTDGYGNPPCGYLKHGDEQSHSRLDEYRKSSWLQEPRYYEDFKEEEYTPSEYVVHSERYNREKLHYGKDGYSNQLWFLETDLL